MFLFFACVFKNLSLSHDIIGYIKYLSISKWCITVLREFYAFFYLIEYCFDWFILILKGFKFLLVLDELYFSDVAICAKQVLEYLEKSSVIIPSVLIVKVIKIFLFKGISS